MSGKEPAASHRGQVLTILSDFFQQAFPPRMDGSFRDPGAFFVTQFFPARTAEQTTERNADFLMEFFPRTDGRTKEQRGHPTFALSGCAEVKEARNGIIFLLPFRALRKRAFRFAYFSFSFLSKSAVYRRLIKA
ncbi:MAG TPA: hypothetical protein H9874_00740 [Candidatus Bilophila faecipullorum]|uniref:Uncharacterized protein n=2 Tax=Bilophila TaxID=35832 RepID=A0A9D1QYS4_9BACT|nr:hypothetical protein [uncultured Bilophila sp.]HIW77660.1 hypothetical protein [Candidatus Bilophila faecipullorum]